VQAGDLVTGPAKLQKAWEKLTARWDDTRPHWNDVVSQQFEEKYLSALEGQVVATLQRMRTLASALASVRNECER
jgi:hypothetical protein